MGLLLLSGCQKKITGEAFVVTKDRNTIKLSLLPIFLVQENEVEAFLGNKRDQLAAAEIENYQKDEAIKGRIGEMSREMNRLGAKLTELVDAVNAAVRAEQKPKYKSLLEEVSILEAAILEVGDERSKVKAELDESEGRIAYLRSNIYEGIDSIPMILVAKTDSEGRFSFVSKGNNYYVFAQARRQIMSEEETYLWVEKVSDNMSLNNDNMK